MLLMKMVSDSLQNVVLILLKLVSAAVLSVLLVKQRVSDVDKLQLQSKLQKQEMNTSKKQVSTYQSVQMVVSFMTIT